MKRFTRILLLIIIGVKFMAPISVSAATEHELSSDNIIVKKAFENKGYQVISSDEVDVTPRLASELTLSDQELEQSWEKYINISARRNTNMVSMQVVDGYVQYAVDKGMIPNTPQARASLGKAAIRTFFKTLANAGKVAGFKTAGNLLLHSLQNKPSNLFYSTNSTQAKQIKKSSECKKIVSTFKKYVSGKRLSQRFVSGSTTLCSTLDLKLAYNRVKYTVSGSKNKKTGVWTLNIVFSDRYDFEMQSWKNAMSGNPAITGVNNMAALAQKAKAIVPYDVKVTVKTTFKESK